MGETRGDGGVQRAVQEGGDDPEECVEPGTPDQDEVHRGHDQARQPEDGDEDLELPEPFSAPL
jgi:hypothetical protein